MLRIGCAILVIVLLGCTASRKLSQLERREPAAVRESAVSELRLRASSLTSFPKSCPKEVKEVFADLAEDRVLFPACPSGLAESIQTALPFLKIEERSTMEEVVNSNCRSLGFTEFGDSLENLVTNYDTTGPLGRRSRIVETLLPTDAETKNLRELKNHLEEVVTYHLPLDRWVRRNGEFVLPEEDLNQLHHLVVEKGCRMSDQEVDQGYRTIRGLEELEKILKDGPQRQKIERFLVGIHKVIEQKLKEFFYP